MQKHAADCYVSVLLLMRQNLLNQSAVSFHADKINDKENGGNSTQNDIENQHTHTAAAVIGIAEVCVQII